jgi:hypothetical protein
MGALFTVSNGYFNCEKLMLPKDNLGNSLCRRCEESIFVHIFSAYSKTKNEMLLDLI